MCIIRSPKKTRFTIIDNEVLNDTRLSIRTLGILCRILSKPDNWKCNPNQMTDEFGLGRDAIRAAFNELKLAGYVRLITWRDANGRMTSEWHVYDHISEGLPVAETQSPVTGSPVTGIQSPVTGEPASGESGALINTEEQIKTFVASDEEDEKAKKPKTKAPALIVPDADIPAYVSREALASFIEMRKTIKKPITARGMKILLNKLDSFRVQGYDVNELLDEATMNCWQSVFVTREMQEAKAKAKAKPGDDYMQGEFA